MTALFTNIKHQEQFERDGYIVLSLFDAEQLDKIQKLYKQIPLNPSNNFDSSSFFNDLEKKKVLNEALLPLFEEGLKNIACKHKTLGTSFLTKKAT